MNKADLIARIAGNSDVSKAAAERALDGLVDVLHESLKGGDAVQVPGLGKFEAVLQPERDGHNPSTGEKIHIPARTRVRFTAAAQFKRAVQG